MQCPSCQYNDTRVLESRSTEAGQSIRRRRECLRCKHRFTTYERVEFVPMAVIKRNGTKEYFDRSKIIRGLVRSCEKTGISYSRIERIVGEIEAQLEQRPEREITAQEIGDLVLGYLLPISEVAYVRFASLHGKFKTIKEFVDTIERLGQDVSLVGSNID
jgi:transcriptional repressor NrdR